MTSSKHAHAVTNGESGAASGAARSLRPQRERDSAASDPTTVLSQLTAEPNSVAVAAVD